MENGMPIDSLKTGTDYFWDYLADIFGNG